MPDVLTGSWNQITGNATFSAAGPADAPDTLPTGGVTLGGSPAIDYYIQFHTASGLVTLPTGVAGKDANLFGINGYSVTFTQTVNIGSAGSGVGKAKLGTLSLSLDGSGLDDTLLQQILSATGGPAPYTEVDVVGYLHTSGSKSRPPLVSEYSFGVATASGLTTDGQGNSVLQIDYEAAELQQKTVLPSGSLVADPSGMWDQAANINQFTTIGPLTWNNPASAPATLPTTGVSDLGLGDLDYYVRFIDMQGHTLTIGGAQLFPILDFNAGWVAPPGGEVQAQRTTLSLDSAALDPTLLQLLASGAAFGEIDVLGYNAAGNLALDQSYGVAFGVSLTTGATGPARYEIEYGSVELQESGPKADGTRFDYPAASVNFISDSSGFTSSANGSSDTPAAAPQTLPIDQVAAAGPHDISYYVRFITNTGAVLTLDGDQFFALEGYTIGAIEPVSFGVGGSGGGAGKAELGPGTLSFAHAALDPTLFSIMAGARSFAEIDILGYEPPNTGKAAVLVSEQSLGLVYGTSLTVDPNGVSQFEVEFGSIESQYSQQNADGSLSVEPSGSWNQITNSPSFSTNGTTASAPAKAPSSLPGTGVARQDSPDEVRYYVQFITSQGTLAFDGATYVALTDYTAGAAVPVAVGGSQSGEAGRLTFDPLSLTLDSYVQSQLFGSMARSLQFTEVDVVGFDVHTGSLVSQDSYGQAFGTSLQIGNTGTVDLQIVYNSMESQHSSVVGKNIVTDPSFAWTMSTGTAAFRSGSGATSPVTAPTTEPSPSTSTVQPGGESDYYVRFIKADGSVLTVDGSQYFAVNNFNTGLTEPVNLVVGGASGRAELDSLSLTLSDPELDPVLFSMLASGAAFKEVDVLGYAVTDGKLLSDTSFGLVRGDSLTIDNSGIATYEATYAAAELRQNSVNSNTGSLVADPSGAFNQIMNTAEFTTNGVDSANPASAPLTLPNKGVWSGNPDGLEYYARFIVNSSETLTINDVNLFALDGFNFNTTQPVTVSSGTGEAAGRTTFSPLDFTLADPSLSSTLLTMLGKGAMFQEVDILGYDRDSSRLVSDASFGKVATSSLTLDQSGLAQAEMQYGALELQQSSGTACYAAGTRIRTVRGDVAIEALREGDRIVTHTGSVRPVRWIGYRRIDLARHPDPEQVRPVLIRAGAVAERVPNRDLLVSPDHAILLENMLIPARLLINGGSIVSAKWRTGIIYYHVELDRHDVILAEGMPAESYLDSGNRTMFENAPGPLRLHADFAAGQAYREAASCAPFVADPPRVGPVWGTLADRSVALGWGRVEQPALTDDPALCLLAAGRRIGPVSAWGRRYRFVMPPSPARLVSRAARPCDLQPWVEDRRRLGVRVRRLTWHRGPEVIDLPLDDPGLWQGWWAVEREGPALYRWTNGDAQLPLLPPGLLEVALDGFMPVAVAPGGAVWHETPPRRLAR